MPAVARIGDFNLPHCSPMVLALGSGSVFVNGRPMSFRGCFNTVHLLPAGKICLPHIGFVGLGSFTVFVHGLGVARFGDYMTFCTFIVQGSTTVFAGG